MKRIVISLCVAGALSAGAGVSLRPGRLPRPAFADTEVSQSYGFDFGVTSPDSFRIGLELNATPSNNVELAFGRDADEDGALSADEAELIVGWDCGRWVVRGSGGAEAASSGRGADGTREQVRENWTAGAFGRVESLAVTTNSLKRLLVDVGLRRRRPQTLVAEENGVAVFGELRDSPPSWFFSRDWNRVRVTARGVDDPEESARIKVKINGTLIMIR